MKNVNINIDVDEASKDEVEEATESEPMPNSSSLKKKLVQAPLTSWTKHNYDTKS